MNVKPSFGLSFHLHRFHIIECDFMFRLSMFVRNYSVILSAVMCLNDIAFYLVFRN